MRILYLHWSCQALPALFRPSESLAWSAHRSAHRTGRTGGRQSESLRQRATALIQSHPPSLPSPSLPTRRGPWPLATCHLQLTTTSASTLLRRCCLWQPAAGCIGSGSGVGVCDDGGNDCSGGGGALDLSKLPGGDIAGYQLICLKVARLLNRVPGPQVLMQPT